jgi:hypothetical protein
MAKVKGKSRKSSGAPKTLGGLKLPKAIRKSAGTLLNSGLGREILADALIAAAGAAAAALTRTRPARNAGHAVAEAGSETAAATSDAVQTAAGAVAGVLTEAARNFLPASLVGDEPRREDRQYAQRASGLESRTTSRKAGKGEAKKKRKGARSDQH